MAEMRGPNYDWKREAEALQTKLGLAERLVRRLEAGNEELHVRLEEQHAMQGRLAKRLADLGSENAQLLKDLEEAGQTALDSVPEIQRLRDENAQLKDLLKASIRGEGM